MLYATHVQLHTLQAKTKRQSAKYIGRGGKRGTTAGRGTKGQKARSGHRIRPELRDVIKRIPKLRGYRFRGILNDTLSFPIDVLEKNFNSGETVDMSAFRKKQLIPKNVGLKAGVKILDGGTLTKKLTLKGISFSKSAREKVLEAGGTIK